MTKNLNVPATPQHSVTEQALHDSIDRLIRAWAPCNANDWDVTQERTAARAELVARAQPPASTAATQPEQAMRKLCDQLDGMKRTMFLRPGTGQHYSYLVHEDVAAYVEQARAALAIPASTATPGLLAEILSLAEQGMCHGLLADDYCSDIVAKLRAAGASTAASEQQAICAPKCFYGDCPPCVAAGLRPAAASEQQATKPKSYSFAVVAQTIGHRDGSVETYRYDTPAGQQAIHLTDEGHQAASASLMAAPGVSEALEEMAADQQGDTASASETRTARLLADLATFDGTGGMAAINELVGRAKGAQQGAAQAQAGDIVRDAVTLSDLLDAKLLAAQVYTAARFIYGWSHAAALDVSDSAAEQFGHDPVKTVADLEHLLSEVLRTDGDAAVVSPATSGGGNG